MKILVISSNLIGDAILSTCVVEHFAKIYPKGKFTFLIGPSAGQIYKNFPATEKIILIKKKKFNFHWLYMYWLCLNKKWDVIIDFRSSLISYFLFNKKKYIFKKNKLLNHIDQLKESFKIKNPLLFIHTNSTEENEANINLYHDYKYIIIFPGGNWIPKIWPSSYYNRLIKLINKNFSNIKFIIVGSLKEKEIYFKEIQKDLSEDIFIDLMGKSLTLTSAYMKRSNLFIGNDSGLMHLSIASDLPSISLFGPTNDKIYGHISSSSFIIRTKENYEYLKKNSIDDAKSYMLSIEPDEILKLIIKEKLL